MAKTRKKETTEKIIALKYRLFNIKNVLAHANVLSIYEKYAADIIELAKLFFLPKIPRRIEGYDISNIFGKEATGSIVVFADGEPDKNQYRKFKIKVARAQEAKIETTAPSFKKNEGRKILLKNNNTAMLKKILERRLFFHLLRSPSISPNASATKRTVLRLLFTEKKENNLILNSQIRLNPARAE